MEQLQTVDTFRIAQEKILLYRVHMKGLDFQCTESRYKAALIKSEFSHPELEHYGYEFLTKHKIRLLERRLEGIQDIYRELIPDYDLSRDTNLALQYAHHNGLVCIPSEVEDALYRIILAYSWNAAYITGEFNINYAMEWRNYFVAYLTYALSQENVGYYIVRDTPPYSSGESAVFSILERRIFIKAQLFADTAVGLKSTKVPSKQTTNITSRRIRHSIKTERYESLEIQAIEQKVEALFERRIARKTDLKYPCKIRAIDRRAILLFWDLVRNYYDNPTIFNTDVDLIACHGYEFELVGESDEQQETEDRPDYTLPVDSEIERLSTAIAEVFCKSYNPAVKSAWINAFSIYLRLLLESEKNLVFPYLKPQRPLTNYSAMMFIYGIRIANIAIGTSEKPKPNYIATL